MLKIIKKTNHYKIVDSEKKIEILARNYKLGKNIFLGERVKLCNHDGTPMDDLFIGDNAQIHRDTTIMTKSLSVLDYTKINNNFYAYGNNDLRIGYNCWFGGVVVADVLGGLEIGNNVCIASHSQIYSHAKFGDTLYGCKINSTKTISLGDDVWIAPNCVVTLASMAKKSMLLAGSVLTKDTIENNTYAGIPAKNITDKVGTQFHPDLNYKQMFDTLSGLLKIFYAEGGYLDVGSIMICQTYPPKVKSNISYFVIKDRKYTKRLTEIEIEFMKFLLPEKAKFIPYESTKG